MTFRQTLTVVTVIRDGCVEQLRSLLNARGDTLQTTRPAIPFDTIDTIHMARWVMVDGYDKDGRRAPNRLVFCSNYDNLLKDQLSRLSTDAGTALDEIYELCEGYPEPANRNPSSRAAYLSQHIVDNDCIFIGTPDRTLVQIRQENALRIAMQAYLDKFQTNGKSAREVKAAVRAFVESNPDLSWAKAPAPPRESTWLQVTLLILAAPFLLPFLLLWLLILRLFFERTDKPQNIKPCDLDPTLAPELERREDVAAQSPFSQLMEIKPGKFRLLTLKGVLWLSTYTGRYIFKNGNIMFIPSIHFYNWLILPEGRLLFFSNFDGSWQSYLGDFIDKAAFGLNGVLSNCVGFPKTWFLFFKGVHDVEHYKAWARFANIPTQAWYTAYPTLTVKNINNNSRLRLGLHEDMTEEKAAKWLRGV